VLDALLCRLVFTCYLFDREVIDEEYLEKIHIRDTRHLRDILATQPRARAKASLYALFEQLRRDFNGDLFSDDLEDEAEWVLDDHVKTLSDFFHGTSVKTGQRTFWPYDFAFIPIETISAIYERFLKEDDEKVGAFYTPRFLAEIVLDVALTDTPTLLGKRFLDPACGSGIFLVGLFNRIAEEWKQANPKARNDTKAKELMRLLQAQLFGVDVKETACRITAFSLYLAYLDQLSPRGIQDASGEKRRAAAIDRRGRQHPVRRLLRSRSSVSVGRGHRHRQPAVGEHRHRRDARRQVVRGRASAALRRANCRSIRLESRRAPRRRR
jgi:hypothetical protein